jgi:hypothetical protein
MYIHESPAQPIHDAGTFTIHKSLRCTRHSQDSISQPTRSSDCVAIAFEMQTQKLATVITFEMQTQKLATVITFEMQAQKFATVITFETQTQKLAAAVASPVECCVGDAISTQEAEEEVRDTASNQQRMTIRGHCGHVVHCYCALRRDACCL